MERKSQLARQIGLLPLLIIIGMPPCRMALHGFRLEKAGEIAHARKGIVHFIKTATPSARARLFADKLNCGRLAWDGIP